VVKKRDCFVAITPRSDIGGLSLRAVRNNLCRCCHAVACHSERSEESHGTQDKLGEATFTTVIVLRAVRSNLW